MADSLTLEAKDLSSALRALGRVDKEARKEAVGVLRDESKRVQGLSQSRLSSRPGGGTYPVRRGMIGRFANSKGAGITLRGRYPWSWAAEFGSRRGWTPRRTGGIRVHKSQARWRRRQFPVWRGNQFVVRGASGPGWIIQPTIRKQLPKITENLEQGLVDVFTRAMNREGVGRGD